MKRRQRFKPSRPSIKNTSDNNRKTSLDEASSHSSIVSFKEWHSALTSVFLLMWSRFLQAARERASAGFTWRSRWLLFALRGIHNLTALIKSPKQFLSDYLPASLSQRFPIKTPKTWLWKNTILSWLSLAKINNITILDDTRIIWAIYFICIIWIHPPPPPLSSPSIFSSLLCTFNAWKTELSGFQNLAFSCLATTLSKAEGG